MGTSSSSLKPKSSMKSPETPPIDAQVIEEEDSRTQLQQKLQVLENEWNSIKQQLPNPNQKTGVHWRRSVSPPSCTLSSKITNIPLLKCSPRELMSSLQDQNLLGMDTDMADEEDITRNVIRRFGVGSGKVIKGRRLFEEEPPTPSGGQEFSSVSCLDVSVGSVEYGGRARTPRRSMASAARVCIVIALMACVLGSVKRFCSFGFGEEEMLLVPT